MERTPEVDDFLNDCLADYEFLRGAPTDPAVYERLQLALRTTYVKACRTLKAAQKVHAAVMRNSERYPMPATIRKYLRLLNLPEDDVDTAAGI